MERVTAARTETRSVHSRTFTSYVGTSRGAVTGSFMCCSVECFIICKGRASAVHLQERAPHLVGGRLWVPWGKVAMLRSTKSGIP